MTGIGIGMSLNGKIPIMVHQRLDFFYWQWISLLIMRQNGKSCLETKIKYQLLLDLL